MGEESTAKETELEIDRKELKEKRERSEKNYKELREELDSFEEAQWEAYQDACVDEPDDGYPPEHADDYIQLDAFEELYLEHKTKDDKLEQMDKFYDEYIAHNNSYQKIIHKQDKSIEDKLNRVNDAADVAKIIKEDKVKTVGIFGEWGTGKSTFLQLIKNKLRGEKKIKIVDLKATEYSDSEKIWTYFLTEMEKEALKTWSLRSIFYRLCRVFSGLAYKALYPCLYVALYLIVILLLSYFGLFKEIAVLVGIDPKDINGFSVAMMCIVGAIFTFQFLVPIIARVIELFNSRHNSSDLSQKDYAEKLGYKTVVKRHINKILRYWKGYHFVFCVDELDRCNNESVMSFLEAIQLIDDCENVHIIYAIDEEVVLKAITEAGFNKPQNYLKKYVDKRVYLESINSLSECAKEIAKEYNLFEEEIESILFALDKLEVNISVREYYHILNTISELREKWIGTEVKDKKASKEATNKDALNWYEFISVAIFYLEGNPWIKKIYRDFKNESEVYRKVSSLIREDSYKKEYETCPYYTSDMCLNDIINSVRFLDKTKPLVYVNTKQ